jgi:hypothetical protein
LLKLYSIFLRRFIFVFFGLFLILGIVFYFFIKEVFVEQTKIDLLHNVDIFSSTLFRYCKNPSSSTRGLRGDLLYRLHLDIFEAYDTDPGVLTFSTWPVPANQILYRKPKKIFQETGLNMAHINLNPSENISNVAISLRDEYGNPYWSTYPQILDGTDVIEYDDFNNGIVYYLTFISEI